ncbi:hypothetical protein WDW89_04825 [Deltaproteobacteria bacterium TL4]
MPKEAALQQKEAALQREAADLQREEKLLELLKQSDITPEAPKK